VQAFSFIVLAHEAHSDWKIQSPSQLTLIDTHTVNSASTSVDLGYIVFWLLCISGRLLDSVRSCHLVGHWAVDHWLDDDGYISYVYIFFHLQCLTDPPDIPNG
jgi:hypothetical protein